MRYDFDTVFDRRGTYSLKWNVAGNELPMWVGDMDFKTAPEIIGRIESRVSHGIFGYSVVPDEWYGAYREWWRRRHNFDINPDWLVFCTGVIPAISSVVRKLTTPGENVLVQTPVYNIFFNCIVNNGRRVVESPLVYKNGEYGIDFADLEQKLADPQTAMMLLCNPHNPVGKIWDRDTLAQIGSLAAKYNVTVVSDEIHCDITDPGAEYTPFASAGGVCENIGVTCISPAKAFNLSGLQSAAVCVPDPVKRHKVRRALNTDEVAEPNSLAVPAAIAAFTEGGDWLDSLNEYIYENKQAARAFIKADVPGVTVVPSDATYFLWLDCSAVCDDAGELQKFLRRFTGLYLSAGESFGRCGKTFLRMNIACPRTILNDGLSRLSAGVKKFKETPRSE